MIQRIYRSDPLAALLYALWPLKTTPLVRQLLEQVSQLYYGMTATLTVKAFELDATTNSTPFEVPRRTA
jgi:hypothetical protein